MLYVHEVKNNQEKYSKQYNMVSEDLSNYFSKSMIIDAGEAGVIADWLCIDDPSSCLYSEILHNIRLPFKNCIIEYFLSAVEGSVKEMIPTGEKFKCFSICEEEENSDGTFDITVATFVKYFARGVKLEHFFIRSSIVVTKEGEIVDGKDEKIVYGNARNSDFIKTLDYARDVVSNEKIDNEIRGLNAAVIWRLLYVIYLINCKNVTIEKHVIDEKLKKKHLSKRGYKVDDYHIVKIHQSNKVRKGETRGEYHVRLHMCRGHFKQVNNLFGRGISGTYWWNPFTRGKKELGEIKKEYVY